MSVPFRLLTGGYADATGPHRGVPPTPEHLANIELLTLHRRVFYGSYDAIIGQELPIEEVKKRYPDAHI